jgi:pyruvate/2-oxoglutarate dehydrogenase complex dihydrolipoamide dehydrogenase (E3) component
VDHIVGHEATGLAHELPLSKSADLLREEVANMMHHPTVSEAVLEAVRGIHDQPVHG